MESVWDLLQLDSNQQTEKQKKAEKAVRDVMDLLSYLLYVRDRELEHQNRLSENLGRVEKQLERKNHIVQTLTSDLETLKQNSAQKENIFKAKEQALMTERKTLQVQKKALEVNCARKNLEGDAEELEKLASAPIDDFTPTPFNMATKESIPQYISASMEALDEKLKQLEHVIRNELPSAEARSDKEVIKRLRQKLDDAHAIINEQDQLLQASLSSSVASSGAGRAADSTSLATKTGLADRSSPDVNAEDDLQREKSELTVLRRNLEKERKLLQEQAVKLDKDRLEFEIAKRDQMFGTPKDAESMLSARELANCSTPQRQRRAKRLDLDGLDSPFELPVSGTQFTFNLLQ
ncbi:unnamed protein product [Phytophthora lilii]|uniref:Unnamed protein product n=1 Tax=Phytophthora lilii TaxID=2077276 RepID=A0A9W6WWS4_9STRA|nr:unnamed protein product [Phytophthora lilii]